MPPKKKKKKKSVPAKVVKSNPPVTSATKQSEGLTNWWDFNSDQNYGISNTNWNFINNQGFDIYNYARKLGYSVQGASLMLALSATEAGYGQENQYEKSEKQHNYWGYKIPGTQTNKTFHDEETGERAGINLVETDSRYADLKELVRKDNVPLSKLDPAMKNYDPKEQPTYATDLHDGKMEGVLVRTLAALGEKIKEIQGEIDAYNPEYVKTLKNAYPGSLNLQQQVDLNNINQLATEENKFKEIQKELQTGKESDKKWYDNNAAPDNNQLQDPYQEMFPGLFTLPQQISPSNGSGGGTKGHGPDPDGYDEPTGFISQPLLDNGSGNSEPLMTIQTTDFQSLPDTSGNGNNLTQGLGIPSAQQGNSNTMQVTYNYNFGSVATFHGTHGNAAGTTGGNFQAQFIEMLTQAVQEAKVGADVH